MSHILNGCLLTLMVKLFMAFDLSALYTFSFQQSRIGSVINICEIFHEV